MSQEHKESHTKLVSNVSPGDVVNSDRGVATILSCERAQWIQVSDGLAFEVTYQINGKEASCIQSGADRLEILTLTAARKD